ncbi:MAG: hypothetical protein LM522_05335, partial [Candidatus Contendobacter sp.]|nr:hypothetical protein [Candidatus Contendobacter sp.]
VRLLMKEFLKIAACALLVAVLSPVIGFWVVALVGAAVFLLPVSIAFSTTFPKTWKHIEDSLFTRMSSLSVS